METFRHHKEKVLHSWIFPPIVLLSWRNLIYHLLNAWCRKLSLETRPQYETVTNLHFTSPSSDLSRLLFMFFESHKKITKTNQKQSKI